MILFSVLATIGTAVLLTLLDKFYDDIIKWLKVIGEVITKKVVQGVLIGCKTFIDIGNAALNAIGKEISKNYSKIGEQWQVTEIIRDVPVEKIPDEIYEKSCQTTDDIIELTKDIEAQLLKNYS